MIKWINYLDALDLSIAFVNCQVVDIINVARNKQTELFVKFSKTFVEIECSDSIQIKGLEGSWWVFQTKFTTVGVKKQNKLHDLSFERPHIENQLFVFGNELNFGSIAVGQKFSLF